MLSTDPIKASDGSGNASVATVETIRSPGATTISVDTVSGIPSTANGFYASMGTPHTFTDPITSETITVISEATAVDFLGHVDAGNIVIDTIAPGYTDAGSAVGDIIVVRPITEWANHLATLIENQTLNPPGMVVPFAGSAAPDHWLMCDGSAVSRSTYADLFTAIGTAFGAGDGSTTFNVPDLRSRLPIGVGTGQWTFTFANTDVNTSTDQIAVTASPEFKTGRKIRLTTTGTLPTGLALATDYYIIVVDSTHIKLATSEANALGGTAIDITGQGSGTNTGTGTLSTYALGDHGGSEKHFHTLSSVGHAALQLSGTFLGYLPTASNINETATVKASSFSGTATTTALSQGASLGGDTDLASLIPPYAALNYIIKT